MRTSHCATLQGNSQIAAVAGIVAYNVIVYVAKATTQPATEADILKTRMWFHYLQVRERRAEPLWGLGSICSNPACLLLKKCLTKGTHTHKEAYADSFIHSFIHWLSDSQIASLAHPRSIYLRNTYYVPNTGTLRVDDIDTVFAVFAVCLIYDIMKLWWRSMYRVLLWGGRWRSNRAKVVLFFSPTPHREHLDDGNLCYYLLSFFPQMTILMRYLSSGYFVKGGFLIK